MADELIIKIGAKVEDATKGIQEVRKQLENLNQTVTTKGALASFIGNLGSTVTMKAFSLVADGLSEMKALMIESVEAAAEAEVSLNKFNTALALSGKYSKEASKDFTEFAASLQETTTVEDDAVLKAGALIQSLGNLSNEGLKKATTAAVNLSSALGIDLMTASNLIGKAAVGNTQMFQRYGIIVRQTGDDAKDFAGLLDQISSRFGGAAQAELMTYQGAMTQLKNIFGDFKEALGSLITENPIVLTGISALKDMFVILKKIVEENKELFMSLIGEGFTMFLKTIPALASGFGLLVDASFQLANGLRAVKDLIFSISQGVLSVGDSISGFYNKTKELVGFKPSKGPSNAVAASNVIDQWKYQNDKEMLDSIEKQRVMSDKIKEFSLAAETAVTNRVSQSMNLNTKEKDHFLQALSEKNKGHQVMTKSMAKNWEELQKIEQEVQDSIGKRAKNIFKPVDIDMSKLNPEQRDRYATGQNVGIGVGIAGSVLGGTGGAQSLISSALSAGANMLLPGLGEAIGPIINALMQGPDAVKQFITDFIDSVPVLIENLVLAIPAVVEALIEKIPSFISTMVQLAPHIIKKLVEQSPKIIEALVEMSPAIVTSLASNMPEVAWNFITALVNQAPRFVTEIINQIGDGIKGIFSFGGGDDGLFGLGVLGLAKGGQGFIKQVPTGFMNDTYPARLTSGELIVDRDTATKLKSFLDSDSSQINSSLLAKILDMVSKPIEVSTSVEVNKRAFADIILELNRTGVRLA
jgi:hypothetical protein